MEKYGVEFDKELTKTADSAKKCPKCGKQLDQPTWGHGVSRTPYCENCGTEPFEKRPEQK